MIRLSATLAAMMSISSVGCTGAETPIQNQSLEFTQKDFVVSGIKLPATITQAVELGLDTDGDGVPNNAIGHMLSLVRDQASIDLQGPITNQLNRGDVILLVSTESSDYEESDDVITRVIQGREPMPLACKDEGDLACRGHLQGGAYFSASTDSLDDFVGGTIVDHQLVTDAGDVFLQMKVEGVEALLPIRLKSAVIQGKIKEETLINAKLHGAIALEDIQKEVLPPLADLMGRIVSEECQLSPEEGCCPATSQGKRLLTFFDANHDCQLPFEEVRDNPLLQIALRPDVATTPGDDTPDAMSIGLGISAVQAFIHSPAE